MGWGEGSAIRIVAKPELLAAATSKASSLARAYPKGWGPSCRFFLSEDLAKGP